MTRGPCTFREADIRRALRAAKKAGVPVDIKIMRSGDMVITRARAHATNGDEQNPWDEVLTNAPDQKRPA